MSIFSFIYRRIPRWYCLFLLYVICIYIIIAYKDIDCQEQQVFSDIKKMWLYVIIGDIIGSLSGRELVWQVQGRNHTRRIHSTRSTVALIVCVSFVELVKIEVSIHYCVAL